MTVSPSLTSKPMTTVSRFGIKTGGNRLVIWTSKSSQQFFGLNLKTKRVLIYQLCHKTDGRETTQDMY
jgi:hypothetical protein